MQEERKKQEEKMEFQKKFEAVSDDKKEKAFADALGLDFVMTDDKLTDQEKEDEELGVNLLQTGASIEKTLKTHIKNHLRKTRKMKQSQLLMLSEEEPTVIPVN